MIRLKVSQDSVLEISSTATPEDQHSAQFTDGERSIFITDTDFIKESISSLSCSVSEDEQRFLNHFSGGKPGQTLEVDSEVFTDESQRWISVSNRRECVRRRTAERMTPQ